MVGQVFLPPYRHAQFVYLEPHLVTAWKREHGPGVVRGVVEVEYLFRYRVQGDERLHVGLLPVDADVTPAVRRRADMVRMEQHDVHICQPRERRKKHQSKGDGNKENQTERVVKTTVLRLFAITAKQQGKAG